MTYKLRVATHMRSVNYNEHLAVTRSLRRLMVLQGLTHDDRKSAVKAAQIISRHVLVEYVMVTRETQEGRWCNGAAIS